MEHVSVKTMQSRAVADVRLITMKKKLHKVQVVNFVNVILLEAGEHNVIVEEFVPVKQDLQVFLCQFCFNVEHFDICCI